MGDIIILTILIILTFSGFKKGFLKTLTGVVSIVLSFVIAFLLCSQTVEYIKTTPVYDTIYENIEKRIVKQDNESTNVADYGTTNLNFPREFVKKLQKDINGTKAEVSKAIVEKTVNLAIKVLSLVALFVVARILVAILMSLIGVIKKLPVIGWFDKLLGALFGFLRGILVIYLLLAIVTVCTAFNTENIIIKEINHSEFAKVMYNNNVFLDFIYKD